jgi:hypothetical protein
MADQKTKPTEQNAKDFIESFVENEKKKEDSLKFLKLFEETTNQQPVIWGESIIGFGKYNYTYASGHSGYAPIVGFSPRKTAFSLYVYTPCAGNDELLKDLGKFKMGKACIYVKKIEDIDTAILKRLIQTTRKYILEKYEE